MKSQLLFLKQKFNAASDLSKKLFYLQLVAHVSLLCFIFVATSFHWVMFGVAYFLYMSIGFSITFHRLLSHRAFKSPTWFKTTGVILGTIGAIGSPLSFVSTHRTHHLFSDKAKDTYSTTHLPWWYSQWFSMLEKVSLKRAKDLFNDPVCRFAHRYFIRIHIFWFLLLFIIEPMSVVYLYLAPIALMWNVVNMLNTISHWPSSNKLLYRNFNTRDRSVNCIPIALIAFGEGLHNNHHHNSHKKKFAYKWWEIDISYYLIMLFGRK